VFKRIIWMGVGATAGVGASVWANRQVKRTVARLAPDALSREVAGRARTLGRDLADALVEGRQAMREREAELQAKLDATPNDRPPPGRPQPGESPPERPPPGRPRTKQPPPERLPPGRPRAKQPPPGRHQSGRSPSGRRSSGRQPRVIDARTAELPTAPPAGPGATWPHRR